jgi:hypothetical protein
MDLSAFLKDKIYFKIVGFFYENPASIDTPRGVAAWTGETRNDAKKALTELARLKILTAHGVSSTTAYSFTRDPNLIKKIKIALQKIEKKTEKVK